MGHVNHDDLHCMVEKGMVTGISLDMSSKAEFCKVCIKAKVMHKPFLRESKTEYNAYGNKIVSDVWGLSHVKLLGGNIITFFSSFYSVMKSMYTS